MAFLLTLAASFTPRTPADSPPVIGPSGTSHATLILPQGQGEESFTPLVPAVEGAPAQGQPTVGEHSSTQVLRITLSRPRPEEEGLSPCSPPSKSPQWRSKKAPMTQLSPSRRSPKNMVHQELISSSSFQGREVEWELKDLRKHKAQEEGALRRRLKTLKCYYDSLKERYAACVRKTYSLLAELEGIRVKRNLAQHEREAFRKEKDTLRTDRDEAIQANEHLLKRLEDGSVQAESSLVGAQTVKDLK
ncbi:hypothetical protein LIER_39878 [Lithospermum erythrorhizon]|uniref:Uncharacterized protein n=1 Tax=Lithospermum erythrorhizon TaxID=34254 RepID=A0AAV3QLJ0_LITER